MAGHDAFSGDLETLTLSQIARGLDQRSFTVAALVAAHLDLIRKWNPTLRAVIDINPGAMEIAEKLDAELALAGRRR